MKTLFAIALACLPLLGSPALAQSAEEALAEAEDDDIWALLENVPARTAYDVGVHASFGNMGYWSEKSGPYIGFGLRGTYGWIFEGRNRIGPSIGISAEGPIPVYSTIAVEPQLAWDRVAGGIQLGASVGGAFMYHSSQATIRTERAASIAPMASLRFGYSKPFSRLGKRFYVVLEPKGRWIVGNENRKAQPDVSVLISVGSGRGR